MSMFSSDQPEQTFVDLLTSEITFKARLRILIGGGTGFVGKALTSYLVSKGHRVTVISRNRYQYGFNYFVSWDENPDADTVTWGEIEREGLPRSMDVVINLAGTSIMDFKKLWTCRFKEKCVTSRVNTTALLAKAIAESDYPPSVWIATSAVSLYPPSKKNEYDEDTPLTDLHAPTTKKKGKARSNPDWVWASQLYASIEKAAIIPDPEAQIRTVIMRLGIVLEQNGGTFSRMEVPFYCCLGGTLGDGSQWFPWVHLDDVVRAFEFAVLDDRVQGPLNVVAPTACTNRNFTKTLGRAMWRPTIIGVPKFMSVLMGRERASLFFSGQHVKPSILTLMGFEFNFPDVTSCCHNLVHYLKTWKDTRETTGPQMTLDPYDYSDLSSGS